MERITNFVTSQLISQAEKKSKGSRDVILYHLPSPAKYVRYQRHEKFNLDSNLASHVIALRSENSGILRVHGPLELSRGECMCIGVVHQDKTKKMDIWYTGACMEY